MTWPDAYHGCASCFDDPHRRDVAVEPVDMRAGADRLLTRVVQVFGVAQAHDGYLFANARCTRVKLLVHDGFGVWCAARRLTPATSPGPKWRQARLRRWRSPVHIRRPGAGPARDAAHHQGISPKR
ncbi:IS66 family insertion sequence element accessory protein TnpB [Roseateles cavernae]|uniref:IS66 family insertion sequence element accessory protein TnpB n=1 Tax=Roseateles cavernae TaxID=3153578 RepID=UPI003D80F77A